MATFAYKGRDARGAMVEGVMNGEDSSAVADQLMDKYISPLQIKLVQDKDLAKSGGVMQMLTKKPITHMELQMFSRQMYTLLKAGVPIMRALAGLEESTTNPTFAVMLRSLRESLDKGRELSMAMREHPKVFTPFYISMVQVGEMTGMLSETFLRLFDHMEFERNMQEQIKSAMRYPTFVVLAMAVAIIIINIFVIPAFSRVFASFHSELPLPTRILLGFSAFMVQYWPLMLGGMIGAVLAFRTYINTKGGRYKWDRYKFKLPIAGDIVYKATLARFARSMALTFKSGMPIIQGMNVVGMVVDNEYMRGRIEQMRDGIERGESILQTASATGVFTPVVLQMIAVGEETGDMDGLMFEIVDLYQREVEDSVKSISAKIEPILITVLGVMVLILALGVFLPMWDLGKASMHK